MLTEDEILANQTIADLREQILEYKGQRDGYKAILDQILDLIVPIIAPNDNKINVYTAVEQLKDGYILLEKQNNEFKNFLDKLPFFSEDVDL